MKNLLIACVLVAPFIANAEDVKVNKQTLSHLMFSYCLADTARYHETKTAYNDVKAVNPEEQKKCYSSITRSLAYGNNDDVYINRGLMSFTLDE